MLGDTRRACVKSDSTKSVDTSILLWFDGPRWQRSSMSCVCVCVLPCEGRLSSRDWMGRVALCGGGHDVCACVSGCKKTKLKLEAQAQVERARELSDGQHRRRSCRASRVPGRQ